MLKVWHNTRSCKEIEVRQASAKMTENGRLTVPSEMRRQLGLRPGTTVMLEVVDGELRARSVASVMERARAMSRELLGDYAGSAVDDLIAERRWEFAKEEAELARYGL